MGGALGSEWPCPQSHRPGVTQDFANMGSDPDDKRRVLGLLM